MRRCDPRGTNTASPAARIAEAPSIVNVGSGRSVSVRELVQTCEEALGRRVEIESDPQRRRRTDRHELVADATLLRETTGWAPERSLRETLTELLSEPRRKNID